jgi:hypothetical protein
MNCLKRSVTYKREKRQLGEVKPKEEEVKLDVVAEVVGLVFGVGALILLYIVLTK